MFQVNPMYVQASRGKFELQALAAAWQAAQTIRRLAWDLVQFASQEYGFVTLGDDACTGSSIMPNKRNPDLAELLRAAAAPIAGRDERAAAGHEPALGLPPRPPAHQGPDDPRP